jgi:hypothetical protein
MPPATMPANPNKKKYVSGDISITYTYTSKIRLKRYITATTTRGAETANTPNI